MSDRAQLTAWMIAAADGDRDAIEPLFRALWPGAVAYAARLLGDHALAEDCVQIAMTRMFGQLDRFDTAGDAWTWTLTHVTWECRTARRTRTRRAEHPAEHALALAPELAIDARDALEQRDLLRLAVTEIAHLAPRDAEVVIAALSDDDALRDALAPATFRKRLERALSRLRTSWRSRHGAR